MTPFKLFFVAIKLDYYQWRFKKTNNDKYRLKAKTLQSEIVSLTNKVRAK